jgi:hypothetical protein
MHTTIHRDRYETEEIEEIENKGKHTTGGGRYTETKMTRRDEPEETSKEASDSHSRRRRKRRERQKPRLDPEAPVSSPTPP